MKGLKAQCPECDVWIRVSSSVELWDTITCPECEAELQLISLNPPELDYADYDEDYDDSDEDLDDFEDEDY